MSRSSARHAKSTSGYEARHAVPGTPGPAALLGTAAKAVPVSLVASAAGSALALSGTASAAVGAPGGPVHLAPPDLAKVKVAAPRVVVKRIPHPAKHSTAYTVISGDSLSGISARFCGTSADYPSLAAASGIANPNLIYPGQRITLNCHHPAPAPAPAARPSHPRRAHHGDGNRDHHGRPARHRAPGRHARPAAGHSGGVSTAGMAAFESCVISRESGGNPRAVNPASGAGGLFQFLPSTWAGLGFAAEYPGGAQTAPVSVQEAAFNKLYAEAGTSPWAPYDGC